MPSLGFLEPFRCSSVPLEPGRTGFSGLASGSITVSLVATLAGLLVRTCRVSLLVTRTLSDLRSMLARDELLFCRGPDADREWPTLLAESCGSNSALETGRSLASAREEGTRGLADEDAAVLLSLLAALRAFPELDIAPLH